MAATTARQRKHYHSSNAYDRTQSNDQTLIGKLNSLWNNTSNKEMSREDFIESLLHTKKVSSETRINRCLRICLKTFDCIWTMVLVAFVIGSAIYLLPAIFNFISTYSHSRLYDITRVLRFSYIALQQYILLDLSRNCIVTNPFCNHSLTCPCIEVDYAIIVEHTPNLPLSLEILANSTYYVNFIRSSIQIKDDYGRSTLAQIYHTTHLLPEPCSQYALDSMSINVNYYSLGSDELYWNELQAMKDPWSFSWFECPESVPSIKSLLPDYQRLLSEGNWEEKSTFFMISSQWAPSATPYCPDGADGRLLLVLKGTLQIMIDPASEHCAELCMSHGVSELYTLSEGDAVIYNVKYWMITDKTWSKTSFSIFSCLSI